MGDAAPAGQQSTALGISEMTDFQVQAIIKDRDKWKQRALEAEKLLAEKRQAKEEEVKR